MWYRQFQFVNNETSEVKIEPMCGLEIILTEILKLIPNLDGVQEAANQGRNAVWGMAAGMAAHGWSAPIQALQTGAGERIVKSLEQNAEQVDIIDTEPIEQIEDK
jgi:hypothetical protein